MGQNPSKKPKHKSTRIDDPPSDGNRLPSTEDNKKSNKSFDITNKPHDWHESPQVTTEIWSDLPFDIVLEIFVQIDVIDIIRLQAVCQIWREFLQSQHLWRSMCQKNWPGHLLHNISNYFKFFLQRGGVYFIRSVNQLNRLATPRNEKTPLVNSSMIRISNYHELDNGLVLMFEKSMKQHRSKWSKEFWSFTAPSFKHGSNLVLAPKFLEDEEHDYIVLENSFNNDISALFGPDLCEKKIIKIITQIINALKTLHEHDIVAGNWSDLSFAVDICNDWFELKMFEYVQMYSVAPSPGMLSSGAFYAPEAISDCKVVVQSDLWILGSVTYTLLVGRPPFFSEVIAEEYHAVVTGKYTWPTPTLVTDLAKDFVDKLLVLDPLKRMTLKEALEHPWIADPNPSTVILEDTWRKYTDALENNFDT